MFTPAEIRAHLSSQGFHNVSDVTVKMLMERMELEILQERQEHEKGQGTGRGMEREQRQPPPQQQRPRVEQAQENEARLGQHTGLGDANGYGFKTLQQRRQEQVHAKRTAASRIPRRTATTNNTQSPPAAQVHSKSLHTSFSEPNTFIPRSTFRSRHDHDRNNHELHTATTHGTYRSQIPKLKPSTTNNNAEQPQPYFSDADKFRITGRIKFDPIAFDKSNPLHAKLTRTAADSEEDDDRSSDLSENESEPEDQFDDSSSESRRKKWTLDGDVLNNRNVSKQHHPIDNKFFTSSARYPTYRFRHLQNMASSQSVPSEEDHEYDSSFYDEYCEHDQPQEKYEEEGIESFHPYHPPRSSIGIQQVKELKQRGLLRGYGEGGFRRTDIVDRAAAYRAEWNSSPFLRRLGR